MYTKWNLNDSSGLVYAAGVGCPVAWRATPALAQISGRVELEEKKEADLEAHHNKLLDRRPCCDQVQHCTTIRATISRAS